MSTTTRNDVYHPHSYEVYESYGEILYPDVTAHRGYMIFPADWSIRRGDLIACGTGHEGAPLDDPRPAMSHEVANGTHGYGAGLKLVAKNYRRVTEIGTVYVVGVRSVRVRKIYFQRSSEPGYSY